MDPISPHVSSIVPATVAASVRERGYVALDHALTPDALAALNADAGGMRPEFNANAVGPVYFKNQRYLTHCLARSSVAFDVMVRSWCFAVMKAYFGEGFRLTDHRFYVTGRSEVMQWHVDNKFDDRVPSAYPGLIFIFYLNDAVDGEFQIVEGSREWSRSSGETDFPDEFIHAHHGERIVNLPMAAGGCVIYDTTMVHRAHPIRRRGFERRSLFFQVEKKAGGGEPILIDTAFAGALSAEQQYFLGFGVAPEYPVFPASSLATIRFGDMARHTASCFLGLLASAVKSPLWSLSYDRRQWLKQKLARRLPE